MGGPNGRSRGTAPPRGHLRHRVLMPEPGSTSSAVRREAVPSPFGEVSKRGLDHGAVRCQIMLPAAERSLLPNQRAGALAIRSAVIEGDGSLGCNS